MAKGGYQFFRVISVTKNEAKAVAEECRRIAKMASQKKGWSYRVTIGKPHGKLAVCVSAWVPHLDEGNSHMKRASAAFSSFAKNSSFYLGHPPEITRDYVLA